MKTIVIGILIAGGLGVCYVSGWKAGDDSGARQMARHILHPRFHTDKFEVLVEEECAQYGGKPEYQTSEFQWKGSINREYSDMMLGLHGLKHDEGWRIDCPKCENLGASIKRLVNTGWTDYRLFTNTMDFDDLYAPYEGCQWYCRKCLYPLGTDWKIVKLGVEK